MDNLKLIDAYKGFLQNYSMEQLRHVPEEGVWSVGQMYDHLIVSAQDYLDNVEDCASAGREQEDGKTEFGETIFSTGGFPPIKIKLPDEMNAPPDNSKSREVLILELEQLMTRVKEWEKKVGDINQKYKAEHGGFGWLNAREWFALIEMHFRHHLMQKDDLDKRLGLKADH
ncbi:DinB family protein [Jeotgalibacillus sp. ET6]|uniref:DinB family protein n=1 Tax=Jeotgalibacillus sp. ET6 TaxID=3037260 RepID=UPI00241844DD|nr:DinB family protein [Jeotgalibacillus sp. ET6]MDG5473144.1 DinB family protein [Jeotgalibacillus sp. ET6]